nr:hypothetical protein [Tanacetum cinerariifolium]
SGDDNRVSGDGGGVGMESSLATSTSEGNNIGAWDQIYILEVVRYASGGCGVAADSLVSNDSVSSAEGTGSIVGETTESQHQMRPSTRDTLVLVRSPVKAVPALVTLDDASSDEMTISVTKK